MAGVWKYAPRGHTTVATSCHLLSVFPGLVTLFPTSYHLMGNQSDCPVRPSFAITCCVTVDNLLTLSVPPLPHL